MERGRQILRLRHLLAGSDSWHALAVQKAEAPNGSADSEEVTPRPTKASHELLLRIYNRPEYTAVVRAIGDLTWDVEDARDLVMPLMRRFGVERILDATSELLTIESQAKQTTARLADEVRRYAVQLLGNRVLSAKESSTLILSELPRDRLKRLRLSDQGTVTLASDYVQVDRKRSFVVTCYERNLTAQSIRFRHAKNSDLHELTKPRALSVDFVCECGTECHLTLVRRALTDTVRARLVKLLQRFGPNYVGVRVWPIGPGKTWMWEKEWIMGQDTDALPTCEALVQSETSKLPAPESAEGQLPRPTIQRELF